MLTYRVTNFYIEVNITNVYTWTHLETWPLISYRLTYKHDQCLAMDTLINLTADFQSTQV